ncbi:MAG: flagellar biosynthesis anti-sigma factor FlgM [Clostridiaceae bacterium]
MKINGVSTNKILSSYGDNKKRVDMKEVENQKSKDSLQISRLGKSLINFSLDFKSISSNERIEKLKEEVDKGTYNVEEKLIAQGILEEMKRKL